MALDGLYDGVIVYFKKWCPHTDSNRGPTDYKRPKGDFAGLRCTTPNRHK